jgi:hypothetical protein
MIPVLVPLVALALCLGVGLAVLGTPPPVVVVGAPALPDSGAYADRVVLSFSVAAHDGTPLDDGLIEVGTDGRTEPHALRDGAVRVLVEGAGEHRVAWRVRGVGGATTTGHTVVRIEAGCNRRNLRLMSKA